MEEPRADEIVVRLVSSGICHTDLTAMNPPGLPARPVPLPMVYGHEGAGVVEAIGPGVTSLQPGDYVVLSFDFCGKCDRCVAGLPNYCRQFVLRNFSGG